VVPGLDVVLPGPGGLTAHVVRTGDNQWLLGIGQVADELRAWPATIGGGGGSPSPVVTDPGIVAATGSAEAAGFLARIELDACGAWVTMTCTADLRLLVVRRAGWVDERGDAVTKRHRPWPEDRVGLGPGDAVVVVHRPVQDQAEHDRPEDVDPVAERLLDHLESGASGLVEAIRDGPRVVAAVAVPTTVAGAGTAWVAEATGVAETDLVLPGYPLGDREPERWRRPPSAPRRATFRLHRDLTRLRDLRGVLGRLVRSWRLQDRLDDEILTLLTTELATNSLVHTETAATATITYIGPLVRVEVHDGSPRMPERKDARSYDIGGRGIALIEEMAADWGSTVTPTGKRTWFDLPVVPPGSGPG